jgi:hypothetical protein
VASVPALSRNPPAFLFRTPVASLRAIRSDHVMKNTSILTLVFCLQVAEALARRAGSASLLDTLTGGLQHIREYFAPPRLQAALEAWVRQELDTIPRGDPGNARYQTARLALLGQVGRDPAVLQRARETVEQYLASPPGTPPPAIDPLLLDAFVRMAASNGDRPLYQHYRRRAEAAITPEERYRFLYALADFRDPGLSRDTFEYALSPKVRTQDASLLISRLPANPAGRATWPLIQTRWDRLSTTFGAFGGTGRIIEALGQFCSGESARQIDHFFDSHSVGGAQRTLEQSLDRVQRCAAVAEGQADHLRRALEPPHAQPHQPSQYQPSH